MPNTENELPPQAHTVKLDPQSRSKQFKCCFGDCKWEFATNYKLQRHMKVHIGRGLKNYMCGIDGCGKMFSTVYNLRAHMKLHFRVCTEVCPEPGCTAKFSTRRLLDCHIKEQHVNNKPYRCSYPGCGKSFAFKWNMMSHARKHRRDCVYHVSDDSLVCKFDGCGRRFSHPCRLQQHQRIHTGERPYLCLELGCGWSFATASGLRRHMERHTGQRRWVCLHEGCGKAFRRMEHIRGHMSTHSDDRLYSCSIPGCDAKFKNKSNLYVHKRRHESKTIKDEEDFSDVSDVAAYASVIASSVNHSADGEMTTSHGLTFPDVDTGAFYLQTQLLQDDPLTPDMCDLDESGVDATADTSPVYFNDLDIDDTATTINLHDLE